MDFREILLIASKAQGVNNVPVSISRGATIGDPGLQVPSVWSLELPGISTSAPGEERSGRRIFSFFTFGHVLLGTGG